MGNLLANKVIYYDSWKVVYFMGLILLKKSEEKKLFIEICIFILHCIDTNFITRVGFFRFIIEKFIHIECK